MDVTYDTRGMAEFSSSQDVDGQCCYCNAVPPIPLASHLLAPPSPVSLSLLTGFLAKNMDNVNPEIVELMESSSLPFMCGLFSQESFKQYLQADGPAYGRRSAPSTVCGRFKVSCCCACVPPLALACCLAGARTIAIMPQFFMRL